MAPPQKRRKTESKVEEIVFDPAARQEYLTGFHKRKVQRTKHAQEIAEKRAREDKIAERKKLREERKADLERHVQQVNSLLRASISGEKGDGSVDGEGTENADEQEWEGIEESEPPPIDHEAEYIDEDKYTTVTVEAMDLSREALLNEGLESEDSVGETTAKLATEKPTSKARKAVNSKLSADQKTMQNRLKKRKKRDFKYESKTERKVSRVKERSKNSKQAKARRAG